jgi:hypothetical protein
MLGFYEHNSEPSVSIKQNSLTSIVNVSLLIAEFRLSKWFIVDVDSALGSLRFVDVGSVADVLEVHGATVFRVKVSRVGECSCIYRLWWKQTPRVGVMPSLYHKDSGRELWKMLALLRAAKILSETDVLKWLPNRVLSKHSVA